MTEEEFLGYEAGPVQDKKKNFFEAIAGNPRIPIFAFLGLVLLVAIGFGVVSILSGSDTPNTTSITLNQPKDNKASITSEQPPKESVNLPKDTSTLITDKSVTTASEEEDTPPEVPEPAPEKVEAENQLKQELLAARDDHEERKPQPEYKAIKVDNKENLKVPTTEIKIEKKNTQKEKVIVEKAPEKKATAAIENPPPPAASNPTPTKKEAKSAQSAKEGDFGTIYRTGNYRKLTPELMNELVKSIDYRFQKIGKQNNACIEMNAISGNDRALSYAKEVQSFLRGQGYDVSSSIKQVYLTKPVQDVWVWFNNDCVSLTVGTPKN